MRNKTIFSILVLLAVVLSACSQTQVGRQCTSEAMLCPDGSAVGRTGPNCEFASCPQGRSTASKNATIQPGTGTSSISSYPDNPMSSIPEEVSTRFIIEHRSALNGKTVTVKGTVISTLLGEAACPTKSDKGQLVGNGCGQPRIFLGESTDHSYDLIVLLNENDVNFKVGQIVGIQVLVSSNKDTVILRKSIEEAINKAQADSGIDTISKDLYSGHEEQKNYVIKNNEEWKDLWNKINSIYEPSPPLPEVDFDKYILLAVFQGTRSSGGYTIQITNITETDSGIEVLIKETSPGTGCMTTGAMTAPYHIVKIQKTQKAVEFKTENIINNC